MHILSVELKNDLIDCNGEDSVIVKITNIGIQNLSNFPVVYGVVDNGVVSSSPVTETVPSTLIPGDTLTYTFATSVVLNNPNSSYQIKAWIDGNAIGDANATNDTTISGNYSYDNIFSLPFQIDFLGYSGYNIGTIAPGWQGGYGYWGEIQTMSNNAWPAEKWLNNPSSPFGVSAKIEFGFSGSNPNPPGDWIISPKFTVPSNGVLIYDLGVTDYRANYSRIDSFRNTDSIVVGVSTDCGISWTPLKLYQKANMPSEIGIREVVDLSAYAGQTVRLAFYGKGGTIYPNNILDVFLDNINVKQTDNNDVGIAQVKLKNDLLGCSGSDSVVIIIKNFGLNAQSSIPVKYEVYLNGSLVGTPVTETVNLSTPLAFGQSITYTFYASFTVSGNGEYEIRAYTELAGDNDNSNDMFVSKIHSYKKYSPTNASPWLETFDSFGRASNGLISDKDTLKNGWFRFPEKSYPYTWKVGISGNQYTYYTGPYYDHTTGSGNYIYTEASSARAGKTTAFYSPCIDLTSLTVPKVSWWYYLFGNDIDSLSVEVSNDGINWTQLKYYNGPTHTWDNQPWLGDTLNLTQYKGTTIRLRFVGFMLLPIYGDRADMAIDDVSIFNQFTNGDDLEATSITPSKTNVCLGDTINVDVVITNVGNTTINGGSATLNANIGGNSSNTPINKTLAPGDTAMFHYSYIATASDNIDFYAIVNFASDINNANDSTGITINVTQIQFTLVSDTDTVAKGDTVCFSFNFTGKDSVLWQLDTTGIGSLADGASKTDTFACISISTYNADTLSACATVYKNGCFEKMCDSVYVDATVKVINTITQTLKVYPNPVKNVINITLNGEALVELYDTRGIKLYSGNVINASTIDVSNLSKGVYILKVIARDEVLNIKVIKE